MQELNDFYNEGFGWICRHCERELASQRSPGPQSRLMTEGEAESKQPQMSNDAPRKMDRQDAANTLLPTLRHHRTCRQSLNFSNSSIPQISCLFQHHALGEYE
jgi:hypothetical protein